MVGSLFFNILQKSKENKEIICIWRYDNDDEFWLGYVIDFNEELLTLQNFTRYGKPNGITVEKIEDIKCIDFDDDYSRVMECIIDYAETLEKDDTFTPDISLTSDWKQIVIKQLYNQGKQVAHFEFEDEEISFYGYVVAVSNYDFIIQSIGETGLNTGKIIYRMEDVLNIHINDIESRRREMLYKWRNTGLQS